MNENLVKALTLFSAWSIVDPADDSVLAKLLSDKIQSLGYEIVMEPNDYGLREKLEGE